VDGRSTGTERAERRGIRLGGRSLREHTARGAILNAVFLSTLAGIGLGRRFLVAVFLTAVDYGLWGLIYVAVATVIWLKDVGISDKFIQQEDADQGEAFRKAFTLNLLWTGLFSVLIIALLPVFALIYGRPEIILPGSVMALGVLATAFTAPTWVLHRQMRFLRERTLLAIEPVLGFVVTIALAATGAGYWALVIGFVVGTVVSGLASVMASPYRLGLRFDRAVLRDYFSFSWPLLLASASGLVGVQTAAILGEATTGLAGLGAIGLVGSIIAFADRVDQILTQTLYPAVCAVRDRLDLLYESFSKSNRLALLWGMPFGFGLALFAQDIVDYALGDKWQIAVGLLQVFGVVAAFKQVAFNWTAYHRALERTRPMAVSGALSVATFLAVGIPGMIGFGLSGFAAAVIASEAVALATRTYFLNRLFEGFNVVRHCVRAVAPALPPLAGVLALRAVEGGERTGLMVCGELALYLALSGASVWLMERSLVREMVGYLRGGAPRPAQPA